MLGAGNPTGREHPRYLFEQKIRIVRDAGHLVGRTRDLSAGGLFVFIDDKDLEKGDLVQLELCLRGDTKMESYVAEIAHLHRTRDGGSLIGIGVRLCGTTPESRLQWIRHLYWIQEHGATLSLAPEGELANTGPVIEAGAGLDSPER